MLLCCYPTANARIRSSRHRDGFDELRAWLEQFEVSSLHACLEATNTYGHALAEFLYDCGHSVSMVNPARVKGFAQGELLRTKTDKQDASLIARFSLAMSPSLCTRASQGPRIKGPGAATGFPD